MLNVMRENLRHLKWVLILVVVGLVAYLGVYGEAAFSQLFGGGGSTEPPGANASWAARVDGRNIPAQEFLREAKRQDDRFREAFGTSYEQVREQLRPGAMAIQGLIDRAIVLEEARELGLGATGEEVARVIRSDPSFRGPDGTFIGTQRYTDLLRRNYPGGVEAFERRLSDEIVLRKWTELVTAPIRVTDVEVEELWRTRNEKAEIDFVKVPLTDYVGKARIDEDEVRAWYDAHLGDYRRPEGRRIRFVVIDRQAVQGTIEVSDEEVRAFYDANRANFSSPETRRARHILFRVEPTMEPAVRASIRNLAQSVLDRVRKGEDFGALARAMSQDPVSAEQGGDLGFFPRGRMVPAFENAVWSTEIGSFAPVVETDFGFHVIAVTDARPEGIQPFEDVADGIRRQLAARSAQEKVAAEAARIRGQVLTAADLDRVAAEAGLEVQERIVTREDPLTELAPSPEFTDTVFRLPEGGAAGPLAVGRGMAVVTISGIEPEGVRSFDEASNQARADLLQDRATSLAVDAARRALDRSTSLAAAARALGAEVQDSGSISPRQAIPGVPGAQLQEAVFAPSSSVGDRGVAPFAGGAVLYEIKRKDPFDPEAFELQRQVLREELISNRRQALLDSLVSELRTRRNVQVNEEMIARIDG